MQISASKHKSREYNVHPSSSCQAIGKFNPFKSVASFDCSRRGQQLTMAVSP
eukprot:m.106171 g.106171  ORF g.106171 m.106171 type:complete len:52 (-) comp27703_c0_seq1:298-453(-)